MPEIVDATLEMYDDIFAEDGYEVTYKRGFASSLPLNAIKGHGRDERAGQDPDAFRLFVETDDFIVRVDEFKVATGFAEPERLDRIEWTNAAGDTFEFVVGIDNVEDVFRDMTNHGVLWRIHTTKTPSWT